MTGATTDTYVLFQVAGTTYALRSEDVRHMEMIDQITAVPNASPFLEGVVFSRGRLVPVLNLRARFGFERVAHDVRTRLLVVQSADRWIGLVVDSAREFVRVAPSAIQPPGETVASLSGEYVRGIASLDGRLVLVLDVASIVDTCIGPGDPSGVIGPAADAAARNSVTARQG